MPGIRRRPATERERAAERLAEQLDLPFTAAGILFVLVVLAGYLTPPDTALQRLWDITSWLLWACFVLEFGLRLVIAPSTTGYLRRNWWQLVFLAVPFLRFLRAFTRSARLARLVSTTTRGTRTARRALGGRIAWLAALTAMVVIAASELLHEFGPPGTSFAQTLHDAALATISGEPLGRTGAVAGFLDVVLAIYAVVVFAALAGSLGAFFLERRDETATAAASGTAPVAT